MDQFFEKMQEKPEHVRRRIAFGTTAVIGLVLFGIWSLSVRDHIRGIQTGQTASVSTSVSASVGAPLKALGETIKGGIGEIKLYAEEFRK